MTDPIQRFDIPSLAPTLATPAVSPASSLAPEIAPKLDRDALKLQAATTSPSAASLATPAPLTPTTSAQALVLAAREGQSRVQLSPHQLQLWSKQVDRLRAQGQSDDTIRQYLRACFQCSYENQARVNFKGPVPALRDLVRREPVQRHDVPHIYQGAPQGLWTGYRNGRANCAPSSVAMIGRAYGYRPDLSDARLVMHLGAIGGTNEEGTTFDGIVKMASALGRPVALGDTVPDPYWPAQQLEKGALIAAAGNPAALQRGQDKFTLWGHAIAVVGIDAEGRYLVNDPGARDARHVPVTPHQLQFFFSSCLDRARGAIAVF